jgi:hypothetical protein
MLPVVPRSQLRRDKQLRSAPNKFSFTFKYFDLAPSGGC